MHGAGSERLMVRSTVVVVLIHTVIYTVLLWKSTLFGNRYNSFGFSSGLPAHLLTGLSTGQLLGRVQDRRPARWREHVQHIRAVYATHFGHEAFHVAEASLPVDKVVQHGSEESVAQFDSCALLNFCDVGVFIHTVIYPIYAQMEVASDNRYNWILLHNCYNCAFRGLFGMFYHRTLVTGTFHKSLQRFNCLCIFGAHKL